MERSQLEKVFQEKGIKKVKLGVFDTDGVLRGRYVSQEKFLYAAEKGFGFCDVILGWDLQDRLYDNTRLTGWGRGFPDYWARIDLDTFRVIPWESDTASFLCDLYHPDGRPVAASPRQVLKRVLEKAEQLKVFSVMSAEYEFFLLREDPETLRAKHYQGLEAVSPVRHGYSWTQTGQSAEVVHTFMDHLKAFDLEIETFHAASGAGAFEAALRYDDALRAADKAALFKTAVKEIAWRWRQTATFMAKLGADLPGCGGHIHQSLWDRKELTNLFFDPNARNRISDTMRYYIGGQLRLMPQLTAIMAPTINSYKRLQDHTWAPTRACWGIENRSAAIRAIPGNAKSNRVEHRLPGADLNPYLAMAAMLGAGLYGIEHRIDPSEPVTGNAYEEAGGAMALPGSLEEATALLKASDLAREILGEEFIDHFVQTREWEVRQYKRAVTDWERARYLEQI